MQLDSIFTKDDWYQVERMAQLAFWNKHAPGCDEHYMIHKLKDSKDYRPELSRIAVSEGEVIGAILYSNAKVVDGKQEHAIVTFGPLCVHPDWQGCRVGELLLKETLPLVKKSGISGIVLYGEPDYYPRLGFKTCDHFGITTPDGKNFDAFMCYELNSEEFQLVKGKFYEAKVMEDLPEDEVDAFSNQFPKLEPQFFPKQWGATV